MKVRLAKKIDKKPWKYNAAQRAEAKRRLLRADGYAAICDELTQECYRFMREMGWN